MKLETKSATRMKLTLVTLIVILFQVECFGAKSNTGKVENFEQLYKQGQDAYLGMGLEEVKCPNNNMNQFSLVVITSVYLSLFC